MRLMITDIKYSLYVSIMNNKNINEPSIFSIESYKEKDYDTIPFRLDFAKILLDGNELKPLVDFGATDTECFINPHEYSDNDDNNSNDTQKVLNKKVLDFKKVITKIGGRLEYIKSGSTGHTFKGIIKNNHGQTINYAVKVVAYPRREKYGYMTKTSRPENAELMMIRLLSMFLVRKENPHVVLPYGTFDTSIKHFTNLIDEGRVEEDNKHYSQFIERYKKGGYHSKVSILISEWANRGDLLDFIRKHYIKFTLIHWKVFFFQLLSILAVIQSKFPSFRHNDMKANNVLLHKCKQKTKWGKYRVDYDIYIVPNIGYKIKLWDYDFACIPGIVDNEKVNAEWTDRINVHAVQNRYYDMHYFFNTLISKGFFPKFMTDSHIPKEAQEFVKRIVPNKYRKGKDIDKKGRILINTEYKTPNYVIKTDPFFEEFRNKKIRKNKPSNNSTTRKSKIDNNIEEYTESKLKSKVKSFTVININENI